MNRREAERQVRQENVLMDLGFLPEECTALRRISMTLRRWHEMECGDSNEFASWSVERDEHSDKPYRVTHHHNRVMGGEVTRSIIHDREAGAKKRLAAILSRVNVQRAGKVGRLDAFIQTDPRGAALYIIRPGDVPEGESAEAYYTRGVCVY